MNPTIASKSLHTKGILLLLLTTLLWGTSFPLLKQMIDSFSPSVLIAVRFTIAAIAVAPWLRSLNARLLWDGALLGLLYFVASCSSLVGLESISANRSAFIISLNVILVPLLGTLLGQRVSGKILFAAGLAIGGIGIMSWEGGGLQWGDLLTIVAALGVAGYVLMLEAKTVHHPTLPLVAVQLLVMGILGVVWALPQLVQQAGAIAHHFPTILYLALVVTATPVWTQAAAQRWVSAHEAALLYTLEPVFAAFFSFCLLGEALGTRGLIGAGLVLTATVLSQSRSGNQCKGNR